jgi:hypothetical protein
MLDQINEELKKREALNDLILKAFHAVTEKSSERTQVGKVQDAIYKILKLNKSPYNNRTINNALQLGGVERFISTGKWYYRNVSVKESYGS